MSKDVTAAAGPRPAPATPSGRVLPRTPTSGQEGAQPVEVSAGGGRCGSCRLRYRGRRVGRSQGRRLRRHRDRGPVGSFSRQFTTPGPEPRPLPALTGLRPPRGRGGTTPSGAGGRELMTYTGRGGASAGSGVALTCSFLLCSDGRRGAWRGWAPPSNPELSPRPLNCVDLRSVPAPRAVL